MGDTMALTVPEPVFIAFIVISLVGVGAVLILLLWYFKEELKHKALW